MKAPDQTPEPFLVRKVLEKDIEQKGNAYARAHGWLQRKFKSPGRAGALDQIYFREGRCIVVEWKRPGGVLSKLQEMEIKALRQAGIEVYVLNDASPELLSMIFD
jgi:hypothetical protein